MSAFSSGFRAMMPLWFPTASVAVAYAIAARNAGLSPQEAQWMSLTVYSGAAQMALLQLSSAGVPTILLTALVLNLHHILYGLSLSQRMELSPLQRVAASYFLTDGSYAITIAAGSRANFAYLLGVELSTFLVWNVFTALGGLVVLPAQFGFVAPLSFFVMLTVTVKTRLDVTVALVSVMLALLCLALQMGSATVLIVGILGPLIGMLISEPRPQESTV